MRAKLRLALLAGALTCAPTMAHAHLVDTRLGDFYSGALHPLTDLEQVLPWIALAALCAFQGAGRARWVILAFPLALLAGGLVSLVVPDLPYTSVAGLALVAATGLAVAVAAPVPLSVLVAAAIVMGLLHGYLNGMAMTRTTDQFLFLSGMTASGYAVFTLATGAAIAFLHGVGGWRPIALRAGGSWVAAVGIMVLGLHLVMKVPG